MFVLFLYFLVVISCLDDCGLRVLVSEGVGKEEAHDVLARQVGDLAVPSRWSRPRFNKHVICFVCVLFCSFFDCYYCVLFVCSLFNKQYGSVDPAPGGFELSRGISRLGEATILRCQPLTHFEMLQFDLGFTRTDRAASFPIMFRGPKPRSASPDSLRESFSGSDFLALDLPLPV